MDPGARGRCSPEPRAPSILDWGCGPGRVTRHLPTVFPGADVHGADYNPAYVRWCAANLPTATFRPCGLLPPLPYGDDAFDLVISISIFTHLSAAAHEAWVAELARVLRPGGVAFVTTMGDAYRVQLAPAQRDRYDAGALVAKGDVAEGHRTYSAHQPPAFFRALAEGHFEVTKHTPGEARAWGLEQDVWVLRRPPRP